ncbi:hypothetical protein [Desulfospira joergensenii]|uniref:hypothetical protein n=1 Tax=Desulfospira joergensenii TaxID=53329 RepID=UPI0003B3F7CD|nr:hypothetical protein [Desulfospira joergensenii]
MLGFGKKKKKGKESDSLLPDDLEDQKGENKKTEGAKALPQTETDVPAPKKKKGKKIAGLKNLFTKKRIFIFVLLLLLGGGAYTGYSLFFAKKPEKLVYTKKKLEHVSLPQEMLKFSFDHFPSLYQAFLSFNSEINIFNTEIQRIETIGQKYPEQLKIADREKKVWEKSKNGLLKAFLKIEKPIREIYVLYQVNPEQGKTMIADKTEELTQTAEEALANAREQSDKLKKNQEPEPDGFFPGLIFKLKKKFL